MPVQTLKKGKEGGGKKKIKQTNRQTNKTKQNKKREVGGRGENLVMTTCSSTKNELSHFFRCGVMGNQN